MYDSDEDSALHGLDGTPRSNATILQRKNRKECKNSERNGKKENHEWKKCVYHKGHQN